MLRIVPRIVCPLVGVAFATGARATSASPPSGGDQQIAGKRLVLKESPEGSLSSLSTDRGLPSGAATGAADDPTLFGGSLRVRTATGERFDSTYNLPTAGWGTIGAPGRNVTASPPRAPTSAQARHRSSR